MEELRMSSFYRIDIIIDIDSEYRENRLNAITEAINLVWPLEVEWIDDGDTLLTGGKNAIGVARSDKDVADEIARSIFEANGGPLSLHIRTTYIEDLPFDEYYYHAGHLPPVKTK